MFAANAYVIRHASPADAEDLRRLAELEGRPALEGRVLVGEIDGVVAAALSLSEGRVLADPFVRTANLTPIMRMRAHALRKAEATPSVRRRLIAGVRVVRPDAAGA